MTRHGLAHDWAMYVGWDSDAAEEFAERFAGEHWDDPEPPSFPAYVELERKAADAVEAACAVAERAEASAATRVASTRVLAARRRRARAALISPTS